MSGVRLSRLFWIGAATILVVAALVAVTAILSGTFGETEAKILGTLAVVLLSGATAIAGYALVERSDLVAYGWTAVTAGVVGFVVVTAAIWNEFDDETLALWAGTAFAALVAILLVTTQRLLLRVTGLTAVFYGTAVVAALAAASTAAAIWAEDDSGRDATGTWEAAVIFWILSALGFLLLPVLQRFASVGVATDGERLLGELDGVQLIATRAPTDGVEVRAPAAGERLVLRRRG